MVERTDEVEVDPDATDGEAQAAIEEAQSVLDDVESSTGTGNSGGLLGGGGSGGSKSKSESKGESDSGGLLSSFSLPSLSMPSMPSPDELFSTQWFTISLVASAAALFLGRMFIPLGQFGGYLGLFALTFVLGMGSSDSHYLEIGLGAALVSAGIALLQNLTFAFASGTTLNLALFGGGLGLVAGVLGYYFGRDLKSGLGRDVGGGDGPGDDDVPEW
jgi:hypothetical protein